MEHLDTPAEASPFGDGDNGDSDSTDGTDDATTALPQSERSVRTS